MSKMTAEEANAKLLEIDKAIKKLDPAIRAAAFEVLAPYYFESGAPTESDGAKRSTSPPKRKVAQGNKEEFFGEHDHDRPKDNVLLIAAWLYSQYGKFPITRSCIDKEAAEAGLTVPDRSDNTMRQAKYKGKSLFRQQGKGWELTVSGEARVKEAYGVTKGNHARPQDEE